MSASRVMDSFDGEPVSPQLAPLLDAARGALESEPISPPAVYAALEALLEFLASSSGRTDVNCTVADHFFALDDDFDAQLERLPEPYRHILRDIGMCLHDTISSPEVAANFESTPEQLLARLRSLKRDGLVT